MSVQDNRMLQNRTYSRSSPLPGSCYRISPLYCCLKIAGDLALCLLFLGGSYLLYKDYGKKQDPRDFILMLAAGVQCLLLLGQSVTWSDTLRRIQRGEVAELVYPQEFQVRSPTATFIFRISAIVLATFIGFFTVWAHRHATHPGLTLDLFLIGLNVAAWWVIHCVFTRGNLILKSPQVRFPPVAASTTNSAVDLDK